MNDVKVGKSIVKYLETLKNKGDIITFKASDDSIEGMYESIEINIKVNEIYSIRIYNETGTTSGKTTLWVMECGEDGHMAFYGTEKTQSLMCKVITDRVAYGHRVHLRRHADKYSSISEQDELCLALGHRDIRINRLEEKIKQYEELITELISKGEDK